MNHQFNTRMPAAHTPFASDAAVLPVHYRLTSLMRLPGKNGRGIYNEATLYHDRHTRRVAWTSPTVDSRLRRGDIVSVKAFPRLARAGQAPVVGLVRLDLPQAAVNPFELIPAAWLNDRSLAQRAKVLWDQLERPLQHLFNAVLWDGARFYRYATGPLASAAGPARSGDSLRRAVALAEEALRLAEGLPDVARGVLIAAALLHDAGKTDGVRLAADGSGLKPSERSLWIGPGETLLEWLAVARTRVIVPDARYYRLVHVLIALQRSPQPSFAIEAAILHAARRFIDRPERERQADRLIPRARQDVR